MVHAVRLDALFPVWVTIGVLFVPLSLILVAFFWRRRHLQPILARRPFFVMLSALTFAMWLVELVAQRIFAEAWPCLATLWAGYIGTIVVVNVYMVRTYTLYTNFNRTEHLMDKRARERIRREAEDFMKKPILVEGIEPDQKRLSIEFNGNEAVKASFDKRWSIVTSATQKTEPPWWSVYGHAGKYWLVVSGLLSASLLVTPGLLTYQRQDLRSHTGDGCFRRWRDGAYVLTAYASIYLLSFIAVAFLMKGKWDVYGIKRELALTGFVGLFCMPTWVVLNVSPQFADVNEHLELSSLLLIGLVLFVMAVSVAHPLFRTYVERPELVLEKAHPDFNLQALQDLDRTLDSERAFTAFEEYLKGAFAIDHLHFWEDCQLLLRKIRRADRTEECLRDIVFDTIVFFDHYIGGDAPQKINISEQLRAQFAALDEHMTHDFEWQLNNDRANIAEKMAHVLEVFEAAQRDVHRMLRNQHRAWKRSSLFSAFSKELINEYLRHSLLRKVGVISPKGRSSTLRSSSSRYSSRKLISRRNSRRASLSRNRVSHSHHSSTSPRRSSRPRAQQRQRHQRLSKASSRGSRLGETTMLLRDGERRQSWFGMFRHNSASGGNAPPTSRSLDRRRKSSSGESFGSAYDADAEVDADADVSGRIVGANGDGAGANASSSSSDDDGVGGASSAVTPLKRKTRGFRANLKKSSGGLYGSFSSFDGNSSVVLQYSDTESDFYEVEQTRKNDDNTKSKSSISFVRFFSRKASTEPKPKKSKRSSGAYQCISSAENDNFSHIHSLKAHAHKEAADRFIQSISDGDGDGRERRRRRRERNQSGRSQAGSVSAGRSQAGSLSAGCDVSVNIGGSQTERGSLGGGVSHDVSVSIEVGRANTGSSPARYQILAGGGGASGSRSRSRRAPGTRQSMSATSAASVSPGTATSALSRSSDDRLFLV